jgi:hypothetical protein
VPHAIYRFNVKVSRDYPSRSDAELQLNVFRAKSIFS